MELQKVVVAVSDRVSGGVIKNVNGQICVCIESLLDFEGNASETIDVSQYGITPDVMREWHENRYPLYINGAFMTVVNTQRCYNDFGECNGVFVLAPNVSDVAKGLTNMTGALIGFVSMGDVMVVASANMLY